jgi:hypothetical protein
MFTQSNRPSTPKSGERTGDQGKARPKPTPQMSRKILMRKSDFRIESNLGDFRNRHCVAVALP